MYFFLFVLWIVDFAITFVNKTIFYGNFYAS